MYCKVVTAKQMAAIEKKAYAKGALEESFMENAGKGVADCLLEYIAQHSLPKLVVLLCGKGNNGGDAYVAGRYLLDQGYQVQVFQVGEIKSCSSLCQKNHERFVEIGGQVASIHSSEELVFPKEGVIVDALFGTGLHAAPREPYGAIIEKANSSCLPIIAVDIPSGVDGNSGLVPGSAIQAAMTIYLGLPKRGFFFLDGWNHVGKLYSVDFGLSHDLIAAEEAELTLFQKNHFREIMPQIVRNQHKYEAGYVVGIAGSPGMPGAANLSSSACLRAGAGIVRLLHPEGMEAELSSSVYELIKTPYNPLDFDSIFPYFDKAKSLFLGPGLGLTDSSYKLVEEVLEKVKVPIVIDADALTIVAERNISLPKNCIITPHIGEMRRLLHSEEKIAVEENFLKECQQYVEKHHVTLVLKGGPSFVLHPQTPAVVVPYGNPGMATAGSGDVLTGVIAAMLSHGILPQEAALAGVFAHAYAGDIAAEKKTPYSMTATDITENLSAAFALLS